MERDANDRIGSTLIARAQTGVSSADLAEEVIALWIQIEAVLTPILGRRGMTVLFKHALTLTGAGTPWLAAVNQQSRTEMDFAALKIACMAQPAMAIAQGGCAFFDAFHELLSNLIGAPLTAQLLSAVLAPPYNHSGQDTRP